MSLRGDLKPTTKLYFYLNSDLMLTNFSFFFSLMISQIHAWHLFAEHKKIFFLIDTQFFFFFFFFFVLFFLFSFFFEARPGLSHHTFSSSQEITPFFSHLTDKPAQVPLKLPGWHMWTDFSNSLCETCRSSVPGWQWRGWTGKWSICRSCWTGRNLWELHWFLPLIHAFDLKDLQFRYFFSSSGLHGLQSFTDTTAVLSVVAADALACYFMELTAW